MTSNDGVLVFDNVLLVAVPAATRCISRGPAEPATSIQPVSPPTLLRFPVSRTLWQPCGDCSDEQHSTPCTLSYPRALHTRLLFSNQPPDLASSLQVAFSTRNHYPKVSTRVARATVFCAYCARSVSTLPTPSSLAKTFLLHGLTCPPFKSLARAPDGCSAPSCNCTIYSWRPWSTTRVPSPSI